MTSILPFLWLHRQKQRYCFEIRHTFVCMYLENIYSFLDNVKFWFSWDFFLKNENIDFCGSESKKISHIRHNHFVEHLILRYLTFIDCSYFKTVHSNSLQTFIYLPKMAKHEVTNTTFAQKRLERYFWNFTGDAKLVLEKALKAFRQYLQPFLSYRENPAGVGAESAPPPWGAG